MLAFLFKRKPKADQAKIDQLERELGLKDHIDAEYLRTKKLYDEHEYHTDIPHDFSDGKVFGRYRDATPEELEMYDLIKKVFEANREHTKCSSSGHIYFEMMTTKYLVYIWEITRNKKYELRILTPNADSVFDDDHMLYFVQTRVSHGCDYFLYDGMPKYLYHPGYKEILEEILNATKSSESQKALVQIHEE